MIPEEWYRRGLMIFLAAFGSLLVFTFIAMSLFPGITGNSSSTPQPAPEPWAPRPGDRVIVGKGRTKLTPAGINKAALDEWIGAEIANDSVGMDNLRRQGRIIGLQPGTRALFLEPDWLGLSVIRLEDGIYTGGKVWVTRESISAAP